MRPIGEILTTSNSENPAPKAEVRGISKTIDDVFDRFNAMFGKSEIGRMFANTPSEEVQDTWARYLHGFTPREIERGLEFAATLKFMPKLGEFAQACRPCLDPEYAWYEAGACLRQRDAGKVGDWTHPAVYRAACTMSMEVRAGDYQRNRARWSYELRKELRGGFVGGIPEPKLRIERKEREPSGPPPDVRSNIERLLAESREHARVKREAAAARSTDASGSGHG